MVAVNRLTDDQLAAIEAADKARTPGEWPILDYGNDEYFLPCDPPYDCEADRAFVALASWAVPALVAEVRRLRQENAALREKAGTNGNR